MKLNILAVLGLSVCMASTCALGATTAKPAASASASTKGPFTCPVTGDKIASVKDAVGSSVYKGKTYYFCCNECKPQFDANPAKYAKPSATPLKKTPSAK